MASLLKNQILKHLSKFTKNLSPDKLQLSAIKGSCEVNNIELDENVLMQLLELPVWMSLTKAHCNYASIKIQWMKLKSVPIYIILDEVVIHSETCENFRNETQQNSQLPNQFNQESGSYGFTNKVFDGITLSINSVVIQFSSKIFSASFELTRLTVESRNCNWKKVDDLTKTRIRDTARGQVLIFKHIEWQTLRFVAKSETLSGIGQAPLRLIANQASCRVTLKKRLSDSALLGARIMLIFDDLLWVLTDSQLLSALHFADYMGDLIKRAPRTKKFDNNDPKNSQQAKAKFFQMNQTSPTKKPLTSLTNSITLLFSQYDFLETSYHFIVRRIEVHLMDDFGPQSERSQCPDLSEGGALQMTFLRLLIDLYPYQSINGSRKHWFRYNEPSPNRQTFINHKLRAFYLKQQATLKSEGSNFNIQSLYANLMSRVVVIRLSDYSISCVSTNSTNKQSKRNNRGDDSESIKLIQFDQSAVIPGNVSPVYFELNSYFYLEPFDQLNFQLPDTNAFANIAPVKIFFEPLTILWVNAFFANLRNALIKLQEAFPMQDNVQDKMNFRAEILMPTIVLSLNDDQSLSNQEYSAIEVKISRILIYNCDSFIQVDYFKSLDNLIQQFSSNLDFFFEKSQYPWLSCDMKSISAGFMRKINHLFTKKPNSNENDLSLTDCDEIDFWTVLIEPVWIEFKSAKLNRYESFLEPINVTLWVNQADEQIDPNDVSLNIFAKITDPIKLQINHNQLIFLLRLIERIGEFTSLLNYDTYMIQRSHFRRDFEKKAASDSDNKLFSFDIEDQIINAIFKSSSFVATIPQVDLFLTLKQEEIFIESKNDNNEENIESSDDNIEAGDIMTYPDEIANGSIESSDNLDASFENISSNSSTNNNNNNDINNPNHLDLASMAVGPDLLLPTTKLPVTRTSPLPHEYSEDNLRQFQYNNSNHKKSNFAVNSSHSFDSSSVKIQYSHLNENNDDTISTFSDISADDSDQQSFIAMIYNDSQDNIDDIFRENEPVEAAEEISENFKIANDDEDTLNDNNNLNNSIAKLRNDDDDNDDLLKETIVDVLQIQVRGLNLIQQSSKGFLSQVFVDTSNVDIVEHNKLTQVEYLNLFKTNKINEKHESVHQENKDLVTTERVTVRIDSFSKGTLRDEMISVRLVNFDQSLDKKTIDLVVEFFEDKIADKVAPTAILLQNVQFKIIDDSIRMPPAIFNVPQLKLTRNKDNKWIVELDSTFPKDAPLDNQLMLLHLKLFQRNLLCDVKELIHEQDRLNMIESKLLKRVNSNENQQILDQVLNQKDLLLQEIELLRKENAELRKHVGK